jgi:hypothetical protein
MRLKFSLSLFLSLFLILRRFFFKTRCDDEDNPIIQEEVVNDSDVLPLFDDKVMATVKSAS